MSGEPKTLTLRELLNLAREHEWSVHFQEGGCVEVEGVAGEDLAYARGLYAALSDAATTVLGVPVVARDEAAELRTENERMRQALDAVDSFLSHEYHRNGHRLTDKEWAANVLRQVEAITRRRLAGGKEQE